MYTSVVGCACGRLCYSYNVNHLTQITDYQNNFLFIHTCIIYSLRIQLTDNRLIGMISFIKQLAVNLLPSTDRYRGELRVPTTVQPVSNLTRGGPSTKIQIYAGDSGTLVCEASSCHLVICLCFKVRLGIKVPLYNWLICFDDNWYWRISKSGTQTA